MAYFDTEEIMTTYQKSAEAIATLTVEQYRVTQENGTERPGLASC